MNKYIRRLGNLQTEWIQWSENTYVREYQKSMWSYIVEKFEKSAWLNDNMTSWEWEKTSHRMIQKKEKGKTMLYSAFREKNKVENYPVKESLVG